MRPVKKYGFLQGGAQRKMFLRVFLHLALRSARVHKRRARRSMLALTVAATVTTVVLALYADLESKLSTEFRKFGANLVVKSKSGPFTLGNIQQAQAALGASDKVVPAGYAVARMADGNPVVVVGGDGINALTSWSATNNAAACSANIFVGRRAESALAKASETRTLRYDGREFIIPCQTIFQSGDSDEDRIFLGTADFTKWTGVNPDTLMISANGTQSEISGKQRRLAAAFPTAEIQPVRQNVVAEEQVLNKTRSLLGVVTVIIALLVAMSVLTTLTAAVIERRKDFAVMKALGASQGELMAMFLFEAMTQAMLGGAGGYILGSALAAWIGKANFGAVVMPVPAVFLPVLAGTLAIAALSALVPLSILRRVEPAVLLKGE